MLCVSVGQGKTLFLSQGRLDRKRDPSSISMGKNGWEKR